MTQPHFMSWGIFGTAKILLLVKAILYLLVISHKSHCSGAELSEGLRGDVEEHRFGKVVAIILQPAFGEFYMFDGSQRHNEDFCRGCRSAANAQDNEDGYVLLFHKLTVTCQLVFI